MSSHEFKNDNHDDDHTSSEYPIEQNENHEDSSSSQHARVNGTDDHHLSTIDSDIPGINPFENSIDDLQHSNTASDTENSTRNSNDLENQDGDNAFEQQTESHGGDSSYAGNVHPEGSDGDDILIGDNTDQGEHHYDGGNGDDIILAGGRKTSQLEQFFAEHQDIVHSIESDQKLTDVALFINNDANNNDVRNIFDIHSRSGHDQIFNFHAATDKVQIDRGLNGSAIHDIDSLLEHIHITGNNLSMDLGDGNSITLVGVDVSGLSANNVDFV
ncbi:MAG: hypothetical protein PHH11_03060 [Methylomonas sp.]|nr:hypothetical protein [Methylomonas sp.]